MFSRLGHAWWLVIALACGTALAEDEIRWAPDIPTARQAAAKFNVPLLIHFYGDNCLPCKTLEHRVYTKRELIETLNNYFICVRVNATKDRRKAAEYQVHSWPTDVFVSPDGKTLYQGVCKQDLNGYLAVLQNVAVMNRDRNVMLAAQRTPQPSAPPQAQLQGNSAQLQSNSAQLQGSLAQAQAPGAQGAGGTPNAVPAQGLGGNRVTGSETVGFYGSPQPAASQQLGQSRSPTTGIQSGPLNTSNQPQAIVASTSAGNQQLSNPSIRAPQFTAAPQAHLPAANRGPQIPGPNAPTASPAQTLAAYPAVPNVAAEAQNSPAKAAGGVPPEPRVDARLISNPYYPADRAQQVAAGNSAEGSIPAGNVGAGNSVVPGKQVSFQPRSGTSLPASGNGAPAAKPSLGGFCPVALKTQGTWVDGSEQFAVKHRGKVYWLSSQQAVAEFLRAPDAASPVLSGYDPMVFLQEGKLVEGSIQYGLHEQIEGLILLFSSAESKRQYEQNFDRYTQALHAVLQRASTE